MPVHHINNISAAILAGGKSTRMGRNKALLKINGKSLIAHVYEALKSLTKEICIIGSSAEEYDFLNIPVFPDMIASIGPLAGIYTALSRSNKSHCFVVACDMPFISKKLLIKMAENIKPQTITTIRTTKGLEPLCSIYPGEALAITKKLVHKKQFRTSRLFDHLPTIEIPVTEVPFGDHVLFNINTPDDLSDALSQAGDS
ncbi:MAG: molybdenum cofactor guanylyltransferase [Calditrichaeota bacterium]|nr:MAG: molybdenum cofactor guanylyltransferase [Calditrichota bacterium]